MSGENSAEVLIVGSRTDRSVVGHHLAPLGRTGAHHRPQRPADFRVQGAGAVERSLEALQGMGVVDRFVAEGQRLNALCVGEGDRRLATLAVGEGIDSPFPFPLLLPKSRTEALLTERLAELGVTIERSVELVGLSQDASGVTATLHHADGHDETVRTKYLAGCDGARSAVRQALDIDFEGYTEPQTFLLADVKVDGGNLDHRSIYLWWHNGGTVAMFPVRQRSLAHFLDARRGLAQGRRAGDARGDAALRRPLWPARTAHPRSELAVDLPHQRTAGDQVPPRARASSPATPRTSKRPSVARG